MICGNEVHQRCHSLEMRLMPAPPQERMSNDPIYEHFLDDFMEKVRGER